MGKSRVLGLLEYYNILQYPNTKGGFEMMGSLDDNEGMWELHMNCPHCNSKLRQRSGHILNLDIITEGEPVKVPCSINEDNYCDEPFCKFSYYSLKAELSKREWFEAIKKELESYRGERNAKGKKKRNG